MADSQAEEQPVEPPPLGGLNRRHEVCGALFGEPLQGQELLHGEPVEVGHIADELSLDKLVHNLRPEVFDVHGRPP